MASKFAIVREKNYPKSECGSKASNGVTEVVVLAAPGSGKRYRLQSLQITSDNDAVQTVVFRNGISGATFYGVPMLVGNTTRAVRDIEFPGGGKILSENASLNAAVGEASQTDVFISASATIEEVES